MKNAVLFLLAAFSSSSVSWAAVPVPPVENAAFNITHYIQDGVRIFDNNSKPTCFHFSYLFVNPRDVYMPLHSENGEYKQGKWSDELFNQDRKAHFSVNIVRAPNGSSFITAKMMIEGGVERSFRMELAPGEENTFQRRTLISVAPDCTRALLTVGPVAGG